MSRARASSDPTATTAPRGCPPLLNNRVYVSSDQMQLSASAQVKILAEEGTELSLREHGSGDYKARKICAFSPPTNPSGWRGA